MASDEPEAKERYLPLWEHLEELRWTLFKMMGAVVLGALLGMGFVDQILEVLTLPLEEVTGKMGVVLNQATPLDGVMIKLKIGILVGVVLSMPVVLALLWRFISPGLRGREPRCFWWICGGGSLLFAGGCVLGFLAIGKLLSMLATFSIEGAANIWTLRSYFDFLFFWLLATGLSCELPLILAVLARLGILGPAEFRRGRPYAVVAIFVVAALSTPPDVISQLMLAVPLWLLYEIGIGAAALAYRRSSDKEDS